MDRVTETTQEAARAVRDAAAASPALPYPGKVVCLCVAELRDLFILSAWRDRARTSPSGHGDEALVLGDVRWGNVMKWVVANCRGLVSLSGRRRMRAGRVIGQTEHGVALTLSPQTAWMDEPVAERIYAAVWRLKRFVAAVGVAPAGTRSSDVLALASSASGLAAPAADVAQRSNVRVVRPDQSDHPVDVRVWQLILALAGRGSLLAADGRVVRDHIAGAGSTEWQDVGPTLPGGSLPDDFFAQVVLFGALPEQGVGGADRASSRACPTSFPPMTAFEAVLWLSLVRPLASQTRTGSSAAQTSRHDGGDPSNSRGRRLQRDPRLVWAAAGLAAQVVVDVVRGWNALARDVGFVNVESMIAPYLVWNGRTCSYAALARPLDRRAFAPRRQERELWHLVAPVTGNDVFDPARVSEHAVNRSVLADEQLRQVANTLLEHLHMCASADNLADLAAEGLREQQVAQAAPPSDAEAPDVAGAGADKPPPPSLAQRSAQRLGCLTVFRYRPPLWTGEAGTFPSVLRNIRRGLTAVPARASASRTAGGNASSAQPVPPGGDVSLQELGPSVAAPGMTSGSPRDARRTARRAPLAQPLNLFRARRMVMRVMEAVVRVYPCSFEQLQSVHATHHDAIADSCSSGSSSSSGSDNGGGSSSNGADGGGSASISSCNGSGGEATTRRRAPSPASARRFAVPRSLAGTVQLVLTDPPYNIRRLSGQEWSEHDTLSEADMRKAVDLFRALLRPGGHVLIFASPAQHLMWVDHMRSVSDGVGRRAAVVEDEEEDPDQEEEVQQQQQRPAPVPRRPLKRSRIAGEPSFRVDSAPLLIIKDPHAFTPQRRSSTNLSRKVEFVVHATRTGADAQDAYESVNYRSFNSVPSRFPAHLNVIDNVRPPLYHEVVRRPGSSGDTRSSKWMRPEQKSLALMEELVQRLTQPRDIVVDLFAGTCVTALACLRIPMGQYRLAVCSDVDARVIDASIGRLRREVVDQLCMGNFCDVSHSRQRAAAVARAAEFLCLDGREGVAGAGSALQPARTASAPPGGASVGSSSRSSHVRAAIPAGGATSAHLGSVSGGSAVGGVVGGHHGRAQSLDPTAGGSGVLSEGTFMIPPRPSDTERRLDFRATRLCR